MLKRTSFKQRSYEEVIAEAVRKQLAKLEAKKQESGKPSTKPRKRLKSTVLKPKKRIKGLRKESKQPISRLQKKLWEECKRIIRAKYPPVCFTCGKPVSGSNDHTAHFIPKSVCGAYLKYDLRNLRRCCYYCNINLGGNGAMYYKKLVETEGQEYVDKLFQDKSKVVKAYDLYTELLARYKSL